MVKKIKPEKRKPRTGPRIIKNKPQKPEKEEKSKEKRYTKDGREITDQYGRSTKVTPECLAKLEQAFAIGATDAEACLYANIDKATMYRYQQKNPQFCDRKEQLKENPVLLARKVVVDAIKRNDTDTAKWLLERKKKDEFSSRVENTGEDGKPLLPKLDVTLNVVDKTTIQRDQNKKT